ncbi:hypothetical protein K488DRAFT_18723, partial [Vararia minispora EC-137]
FYPPNDQATHRDLLLFEERLKTNALVLNRRRSRYIWFLAQLIVLIMFLCCEVFLQTSFLSIPYRLLLGSRWDANLYVHSYVAPGMLLVAATTFVLFFASGLYSEKIAYANKYVPHANKALRNFNMYLNMRNAPRRSPYNPLTYIFPRVTSPSMSSSPSPTSSPPRSPSPTRLGKRSPSAAPIPSIPPTTNPRGELIFSSRVDRNFRESYERYRGAFERKREERQRLASAKTWTGWLAQKMSWNSLPPSVPPQSPGTITPSQIHSRTPSASLRGRGGTPSSSKRSSPVPHVRPERGRS